MMMFSVNPAYDFEKGDEYGIGSVRERFELFKRCQGIKQRQIIMTNCLLKRTTACTVGTAKAAVRLM